MHKIFAILALSVFMHTTTVLANHEGKYVIGEVKNLSGIAGCPLRDDMLSVFNKLPDAKALIAQFQILRGENKCGVFGGNGQILGQVLNDVADQNGTLWRIIHIQYVVDSTIVEAYLITWGTENTVVKKELIQ